MSRWNNRLRLGHIQRGPPQLAPLHQLRQGVLVQNTAPARAEEDGVVLQQTQAPAVHKPDGGRGVGQHQSHHVRLGEQFVGALHGEYLVKAGDGAAHRPLQPDGARGPQGLAQLGEGGAHMARARHQHCGPGQGLHIAYVIPGVIALLVPALGDLPVQGQEAGQHVLRHRLAVGAGGGGHQR